MGQSRPHEQRDMRRCPNLASRSRFSHPACRAQAPQKIAQLSLSGCQRSFARTRAQRACNGNTQARLQQIVWFAKGWNRTMDEIGWVGHQFDFRRYLDSTHVKAARGCSPLSIPLHVACDWESNHRHLVGRSHGAQGRDRTTDTAIFSHHIYAFVGLPDVAVLESIGLTHQLVC